jgi:hypothetical protein
MAMAAYGASRTHRDVRFMSALEGDCVAKLDDFSGLAARSAIYLPSCIGAL